MPTDLPARATAYPRGSEDFKSGQALFLFYFGMTTLALLLVAGERHFGMYPDQTIAQSVLQAIAASSLVDENGAISLPTGP